MNEQGQWSLAPAYDVCHAYRPGTEWVSQHALSINGKRKDITRADLQVVAKQMNIKKAHIIIEQIATVVQDWPVYAKEVEVEKRLRDAIKKTLLVL